MALPLIAFTSSCKPFLHALVLAIRKTAWVEGLLYAGGSDVLLVVDGVDVQFVLDLVSVGVEGEEAVELEDDEGDVGEESKDPYLSAALLNLDLELALLLDGLVALQLDAVVPVAEEVGGRVFIIGHDEEDEAEDDEEQQPHAEDGHEDGVPLVGALRVPLPFQLLGHQPGPHQGQVEHQEQSQAYSQRDKNVEQLKDSEDDFDGANYSERLLNLNLEAELLGSVLTRALHEGIGVVLVLVNVAVRIV
eukprot:CAMPEP_0168617550 /NCGR_PEP_ID=MMETSP0449_2-20121227/5599_1 /TAXON_ID=1082188 /ORGANISM="Strombidium rassoulzadegani, Strain ras09" /LENGTH=247 /DNA_ID=CAMNT_0008658367 /DNA_START=23 /DNA_END=766 /DNA_ORIENTATION=-